MSGPISTPSHSTTTSTTTPSRTNLSTTRAPVSFNAPSPHYQTKDHKRHSLYGVEDRVVIDPGSSVWKVGFSGEAKPRAVFWAHQDGSVASGSADTGPTSSIWDTEFEPVADSIHWAGERERRREVGEQVVDDRVALIVRQVYSKYLMTDPKSRKVIVVENPLLPTRIKEMIARTLFEDLQVPSVSFLPPQLLALLATGRTSGLVVDVGFLETVVLPVHLSRPLFSSLQSTSVASRHIHQTLYSLLLHFARFIPSSTSLSAASTVPQTDKTSGVAVTEGILLRKGVLERILSGGCFVASSLPPVTTSSSELREARGDDGSEAQDTSLATPAAEPTLHNNIPPHLLALEAQTSPTSHARPLSIPIPFLRGEGLGSGTLVVPGWIRERIAEDAFYFARPLPSPSDTSSKAAEEHHLGAGYPSIEEKSVVEVVLAVLEKLPIDLRMPMAGSILVTGGGSLLPGFIMRLRQSLLAALAPLPTPSPIPSSPSIPRHRTLRPRHHPYSILVPLRSKLSILNDLCPPYPSPTSSGSAPAYSPSILAWVGGSVAGSMKLGGRVEIGREKWDEGREGRRRALKKARDCGIRGAEERRVKTPGKEEEAEEEDEDVVLRRMGGIEVMGDWSRAGLYGVGR